MRNMKKQNCWEHMKCGREPGGRSAAEMGVCPAAASHELSGIHGGENGGRACWTIDDSHCPKIIRDASSTIFSGCWKCDFFHRVKNEERSSPYGFIATYGEMRQIQAIKDNLRQNRQQIHNGELIDGPDLQKIQRTVGS
jgi:hypothetical protein